MLDEEMDHIIRDAAENHHPPYNDKAWDKMEQMLDKHLPQKKDNRKYIFFLLIFLLLGGGALYSIYQFSQGDDKPATVADIKPVPGKSSSTGTTSGTPANDPVAENESAGKITASGDQDAQATDGSGKDQPVNAKDAAAGQDAADPAAVPAQGLSGDGKNKTSTNVKRNTWVGKSRSAMRISAPAPTDDDKRAQRNASLATNDTRAKIKKNAGKKNVTISAASPEETESTATEEKPKPATESPATETAVITEPAVAEEKKKEEAVVKAEEKAEKKPETPLTAGKPGKKKDKPSNKFGNNFGITLTVGPDVSFVSLNKLGKATLLYGAGLSYTFARQKLTVRTGFYMSKKIYDAAPDQYHTPGGNYPNLYNVAADCKIYEIPIGLSYHFGARRKHNWFGAAGISSYLMKTENYNYQYKTPSGYTYNYKHNVSNENNHYFSVVTLSAGYQYQLSRRVSLQAEPYVKIPLGGVGVGKVKLNSGGILFTATIRPFAKKD